MGTDYEDSAEGIAMAKRAAVAHLEGDEAEVLKLLNGASHGELAWAAGYMLGMINSLTMTLSGGDQISALTRLRAAVAEDNDLLETHMRLAEREITDGDEIG